MNFDSIPFLFIFLPLFLLGYVLFPWRNIWTLFFSLLFYTWGEGSYVSLLGATILLNYFFGKVIARQANRRFTLVLGIAVNLLILAYFKYSVFLINDIFKLSLSLTTTPHQPLGISFLIFQAISYLVDVYRDDKKQALSFSDFALYISMFPKLIAGPIVRFSEIKHTINQRQLNINNVYEGVLMFVGGLCQKVLISNNVAEVADRAFKIPADQLDTITAWAGAFAYTLQIYFDFAGYSLMAIGLGRILGFQFSHNFNYPYVARSITDFWRRWHISLSSWLRDYLYIPLGGNRKGPTRTYLNILIVFSLCGLWHGAAWTFIAWGFFHGLLLVVERLFLEKLLKCLPVSITILYTLLMVTIGWVFFRADNFAIAWGFLTKMFTIPAPVALGLPEVINNRNLFFGIIGIIFSMPIMPFLRDGSKKILTGIGVPVTAQTALCSIVTLFLFVCCAIPLMAGTYNPFIYFQF